MSQEPINLSSARHHHVVEENFLQVVPPLTFPLRQHHSSPSQLGVKHQSIRYRCSTRCYRTDKPSSGTDQPIAMARQPQQWHPRTPVRQLVTTIFVVRTTFQSSSPVLWAPVEARRPPHQGSLVYVQFFNSKSSLSSADSKNARHVRRRRRQRN